MESWHFAESRHEASAFELDGEIVLFRFLQSDVYFRGPEFVEFANFHHKKAVSSTKPNIWIWLRTKWFILLWAKTWVVHEKKVGKLLQYVIRRYPMIKSYQ